MTGQFTPSGNLDGKKEQASTMGITPFGEQGSQSVDGDGVTSLLSSQLLMVLAVLLSGDGRDERDAADAAVHVPLVICQ